MTIREAGKENVVPWKATYRVGFTTTGHRDCIDCEWCKPLQDSRGHTFHFCMDAQGGAYLEETGICGYCTTEGMEDETELTADSMNDLEGLWKSLVERLNTTESSANYVEEVLQ